MTKKTATAGNRTTPVGRDLEAVHRFAVDLLTQRGLSDWSVFWAHSIEKSDGGGVTFGHAKRILFSAAHIAMLTPAERRDAVRHEVAHAIVGVAAGHSDVWRKQAIELGGSGAESHTVDGLQYPWYGLCPDEHGFVSVSPPGARGFVCEHDSHEEPVPVKRWKKNAKSRALDPGVKKMAETFPEPASAPVFGVGDTVHVIPYGSEEFDNAPLTVLEVGERDYLTRHVDTGDEHRVRHEMVAATSEPDDSLDPPTVSQDERPGRPIRAPETACTSSTTEAPESASQKAPVKSALRVICQP